MKGSFRRRVAVVVAALLALVAVVVLLVVSLRDGAGGSEGPDPIGREESGGGAPSQDRVGPSGGDAGEPGRSEIEGRLSEVFADALRGYSRFDDEPDVATSIARDLSELDDEGLRGRMLSQVVDANFDQDEAILPAGSRLEPRPETWERLGRGAMMDVLMVMADGSSEQYRVTFIIDDEDWWIVGARWIG